MCYTNDFLLLREVPKLLYKSALLLLGNVADVLDLDRFCMFCFEQ